MKKILIILMLTCLIVQHVVSQETTYKTDKLREMASKLPIGKIEKSPMLLTYNNKNIVILFDESKKVNHIGIKLFDRSNADDQELTLIFNFLERYLLELNLTKDRSVVARMLKEDKVVLEYGDFFKLDRLSDDLIFNAVQQDDNKYYINWKKGTETIYSLSFPIAYELLLGQDKLDMEQSFYDDMMSHHWQESSVAGSKRKLETYKGQYYIEKGSDYFLKSLNADKYYKKTKDKEYVLLFDINYLVETIANMMLTDQSDNDYTLAITHHKYGNVVDEYSISLHRWLKYCIDMGCKPYFGLEQQEGNLMICTVIMVNKMLGYNHILHFTVNKDILSSKSGNIYAKLHTYIPMHNVKDLYYNTNKLKKAASF